MEAIRHYRSHHHDGRPHLLYPLLDTRSHRRLVFGCVYRSIRLVVPARPGVFLLGIEDPPQVGRFAQFSLGNHQHRHLVPRRAVPLCLLG